MYFLSFAHISYFNLYFVLFIYIDVASDKYIIITFILALMLVNLFG